MTDSKQKAIELVASFKDFVNPYMGSGMLSTTYDNDAILFQAKKCALVCISNIIDSSPCEPRPDGYYELGSDMIDASIAFYNEVIENVDLVTVEDIFKDAK